MFNVNDQMERIDLRFTNDQFCFQNVGPNMINIWNGVRVYTQILLWNCDRPVNVKISIHLALYI